MSKLYLSAPLPFQGQKRMFAKEYIKVLQQFPGNTTFVDLFGGSGLLSHITKHEKPQSIVVYNDFDGYSDRIAQIPQTNKLLAKLRQIIKEVPRGKAIPDKIKTEVLACINDHAHLYDYIDYITLSSSLLFSMKYATTYKELEKDTLYNNIKIADYKECPDYLTGLTITSCDYKILFEQYKNVPNVVFLVDPPYLSTDCSTYKTYWRLVDYLDVLTILVGNRFIYFTSNKSSIIELCDWIGKHKFNSNPFKNCNRSEFNAHMNFNSSYTDIMLYTDSI